MAMHAWYWQPLTVPLSVIIPIALPFALPEPALLRMELLASIQDAIHPDRQGLLDKAIFCA